jgi:hypothetical protein
VSLWAFLMGIGVAIRKTRSHSRLPKPQPPRSRRRTMTGRVAIGLVILSERQPADCPAGTWPDTRKQIDSSYGTLSSAARLITECRIPRRRPPISLPRSCERNAVARRTLKNRATPKEVSSSRRRYGADPLSGWPASTEQRAAARLEIQRQAPTIILIRSRPLSFAHIARRGALGYRSPHS